MCLTTELTMRHCPPLRKSKRARGVAQHRPHVQPGSRTQGGEGGGRGERGRERETGEGEKNGRKQVREGK